MKKMGEYFKMLEEKYKPLKPTKPPSKTKEEIKDSFKTPAKMIAKVDISDELAFRSALSKYVKSCIGEELSKNMTYCSIKGATLFIVFDHPASLHLYRLQEKVFLEKMREFFKELKKEAPKAYWRKVRGIQKSDFKILCKPTPIQNYQVVENARGDFQNHCKNISLQEKFEQIREIIKFNQAKIEANAKGINGEAVVRANLDKEFQEAKNQDFKERLENEFKLREAKSLFLENIVK